MAELPAIDVALVRGLVTSQFPQWADLPVRQVTPGGWDNKVFHLGEQMVVRLPTAAHYAVQVEKEQAWLPVLAPRLPLPIPQPLARGAPAESYPWPWSVYRWLEGEVATRERISDMRDFAARLAEFLAALEDIDPTGGPPAGPHNFYRGGLLSTYDAEARRAIAALEGTIDANAATAIWEAAVATRWTSSPVWVHGDVAAGNLLVRDGCLTSVLDFGGLGIGDPACDLSIAWTLLRGESREVFRALLPLDAATWDRGRAWTLWKASIVGAGMTNTNALEAAHWRQTIDEVLLDCGRH